MKLLTENEIQKLKLLVDELDIEFSKIQASILNNSGSSDDLLNDIKTSLEPIIRDPEKSIDTLGKLRHSILIARTKLSNPAIIQMLDEMELILESK